MVLDSASGFVIREITEKISAPNHKFGSNLVLLGKKAASIPLNPNARTKPRRGTSHELDGLKILAESLFIIERDFLIIRNNIFNLV